MTDTEDKQEQPGAPQDEGTKTADAGGPGVDKAAPPAKSGSDGPAAGDDASAPAPAPAEQPQPPSVEGGTTGEANAEETAAGDGKDGGAPGKKDGEEEEAAKSAATNGGTSSSAPAPTNAAKDDKDGDKDGEAKGAAEEGGAGTKRKEADDGDKPKLPQKPPKKARTAYFMFADEKRAEVQAAHPGETVGVIAKHIGQMWGDLSPEDKKVYQDRAAEEKARVAREMEALREAGLLPDPAAACADGGGSSSGGFVLPVARIRKICKLDPEVRGLSKEGVVLITKAAELFTAKLGRETVAVAAMQNRRKILPEDVGEVCSTKEEFLFLREDVKDLMQEQKEAQKDKAGDAKSKKVDAVMSGVQPLTSFFGSGTSSTASVPKENKEN